MFLCVVTYMYDCATSKPGMKRVNVVFNHKSIIETRKSLPMSLVYCYLFPVTVAETYLSNLARSNWLSCHITPCFHHNHHHSHALLIPSACQHTTPIPCSFLSSHTPTHLCIHLCTNSLSLCTAHLMCSALTAFLTRTLRRQPRHAACISPAAPLRLLLLH